MPVDLREEQDASLARPHMRYGATAKLLFMAMDVLYGRETTLPKVRFLEILARIPYQVESEAVQDGRGPDDGRYATWADVFRRAGLDERDHMNESLARCGLADRIVAYAREE
ncbi:MAG: hypothetical protein JXR37_03325 [Kiritimatiellae bacterium]|nr:hypothetical protein [Kiritimatiellia bacterium]